MSIHQQHISINEKTRDLAASYHGHRNRVMQLVKIAAARAAGVTDASSDDPMQSPRRTTRIMVLGAGNGNDVDLSWMTHHFDEVHLVDLDAAALDHACAQHGILSERIHRHCPVDFASPLLDICNDAVGSSKQSLPDGCVQDMQTPTSDFPLILDDPAHACDVVVSVGLMSQMVLTISRAFSDLTPDLMLPLIQAVRQQHFRRIQSLLRVGGSGSSDARSRDSTGGIAVLGLDFVSSDTATELIDTPEKDLGALAVKLINQRNFFSGMNPAVSISELQNMPSIRLLHAEGPWRWNLGTRQYLVMGILFQRE
jgi:hypothetical protein